MVLSLVVPVSVLKSVFVFVGVQESNTTVLLFPLKKYGDSILNVIKQYTNNLTDG